MLDDRWIKLPRFLRVGSGQCVRQDEKERMNQDATVEDQKKRKKLLDERSGVETVSEQEGWRKRSKARQGVEKLCACSDPPAISLMVAGVSRHFGALTVRPYRSRAYFYHVVA